MRLSTSRPPWSVPKGNVASGGSRASSIAIATGSCGAIQGASSAASTTAATMAPPARQDAPAPNTRGQRRAMALMTWPGGD